MIRSSWWRVVSVLVVGGVATRAIWLASQYYLLVGPRYRLESAVIALVLVGVLAVLLRPGVRREDAASGIVSLGWLPLFLIAAIALYAPALRLGFLSDDYVLREMVQSGTFMSDAWFFRPIPLLLWRALLTLGATAIPLHLLNVLLHGTNAFLVAHLGGAMGLPRVVALAGAWLFLTFPAGPEAVAWASGIQDVLMTTMALGAVVAFGRMSGASRVAIACLLFALALGSKETAICIPVLMVICWMTPARRMRDARAYLAVAVVTAIYLAVRLPMGVANDYLETPSRYFVKQVLVMAFGTLSSPWRMPTASPDQWLALFVVCALMLLFVHASLSWSRGDERLQRNIRMACWVLASVAPVFTLFFVGPQLEGARYLYLAECAWALLVADLVASAAARASKPAIVFASVIVAAVVISAWSVERELIVWGRAADLRDRVLTGAHAAMAEGQCSQASFAAVPDSAEGVYVFRNGFPHAVGFSGVTPNPPPGCAFEWTRDRFVPRP